MSSRSQRTTSQLPKLPMKRQDRIRQAARRIFAAGFSILMLMVLYLGFFPVPSDLPSASADSIADLRAPCERKLGSRSLDAVMHTVSAGTSIQSVLDQAQPGDTVLILPGTYRESLRVETDALFVLGLEEGGQRPVLHGASRLENGIVACADGVTLEGLELRDFTANGVLVQDADRATVKNVFANQVDQRGITVIGSQRATVENSAASGAGEGGIYISQSTDVVVQGNEAFANAAGFAVIASTNVRLEDNHAHDNATGILVTLLPGLEIRRSSGIQLQDNLVADNNQEAPEAGALRLPGGTGILIASDHAEVSGNEIRGNRTAGVAVLGLQRLLPAQEVFDVGTEPESNWIHDNQYADNGGAPDPMASFGADLLWDLSGWDNQWSETGATRYPQVLPGPNMPTFIRRGLWRVLIILRQLGATS